MLDASKAIGTLVWIEAYVTVVLLKPNLPTTPKDAKMLPNAKRQRQRQIVEKEEKRVIDEVLYVICASLCRGIHNSS